MTTFAKKQNTNRSLSRERELSIPQIAVPSAILLPAEEEELTCSDATGGSLQATALRKRTAEERGKGHTSSHLTYGTRFSKRTKLGLTVEHWPQPTFGLWWTHLCASQETPPVYLSGFWEERRQSILDVGKDWTQIRSYKEETEGNEEKRKPELRDKKGQLRDIVFFPDLKDFSRGYLIWLPGLQTLCFKYLQVLGGKPSMEFSRTISQFQTYIILVPGIRKSIHVGS